MAWSPADGRPGPPAIGVRFLIVTCAHHGEDARIVHRQARSLLAAGHHVTLVSPAPGRTDVDPPDLERVAIPRAEGRRRASAVASHATHSPSTSERLWPASASSAIELATRP